MISVILPTYNRRALTLRAIESVLKQTHAELECIVVDDASADDTAQHVRRIADPRVRYVRLEKNGGACAARNAGMALAKGVYIAFQDSDDVWHPEKLEKQLAFIESTGADVVCCAMRRVSADGTETVFPTGRKAGSLTMETLLRENLCSTQCILGRAEVLKAVSFDEAMPRLQDWDMILRAAAAYRVHFHPEALCDVYLQPDSISHQPGKLLTALQRLYGKHAEAICRDDALALHWLRMIDQAARRCGESPWTEALLADMPRWVWRPGCPLAGEVVLHAADMPDHPRGGATHLVMQLAQYKPDGRTLFLPDACLADALRTAGERVTFAQPGHIIPPCEGLTKTIRTGLSALSAAYDRRFAWETLRAAFGGARVAAELSALCLLELPEWARALWEVALPVQEGSVRRIGVYYHSLRNGGVQRAAAALIGVWADMGYEVTMITAQAPTAEDYPLPADVVRQVIPAMDPADPDACAAHTAALAEAVGGLDLLVYHAWADPMVLFDLLAVKSAGCRFLIHTHSAFTMPLLEEGMLDRFEALPDVYALADGVVTLSAADECYWRHSNPRVYRTVHPLTYDPADTPVNALRGQTILWSGRLSAEKRPMDALTILHQVVQTVPEARLILLGSGDAHQEATLRRMIDADGLRGHVELPGFAADPTPYLQRADVFLCTSAYEGFGLAMAEAQTFGVPVVTYDMPYLTLLAGGGHIAVPQGDVSAAAQALIRVLTDGPYRMALGAQARRNAEENLCIDHAARWQRIFADMEKAPAACAGEDAQSLMLRTLRAHVLLSKTESASEPAAHQTAFVPLPEKGPFKALRKKAATFAQVLLIDGPEGVVRVVKGKLGQ